MSDHRDLALEDLALAEIDALNSVATWRAIARVAIDNLAEQYGEITRMREQHYQVLDQYRALRAKIMREDAAA